MTRGFYEAFSHHLYGGGIQVQDDELTCDYCGCVISEDDGEAYDRFNSTGKALCTECYEELYEEEENEDE